MRMSCNGCRILRKGCSDDCIIKPCLDWINSSDSQANATLFLAKFYGRAGLINLIQAGPTHLRPAIFKSLLYEACGRIVDPISGSTGLLWSGKWKQCEEAVEEVLKGKSITQNFSSSSSCAVPASSSTSTGAPPLKIYDIRHVSKDDGTENTRTLIKRSWNRRPKPESTGRELSGQHSWSQSQHGHVESREDESIFSVETVSNPRLVPNCYAQNEVELELTLGLPPIKQQNNKKVRTQDITR